MKQSPPVIIYQNSEFILGLLQGILQQGFIESIESETTVSSDIVTENGESGDKSLSVEANAGLLKFAGDFNKGDSNGHRQSDNNQKLSRSKYQFSPAYYFHYLHHELHKSGFVTELQTKASLNKLSPGQIVEFTAEFLPNEIDAILDIATPDLVSQITKYFLLEQNRKTLRDIDDFETLKHQRKLGELNASDAAQLAREVAKALRSDFRSSSTKEYYGEIKLKMDAPPITAVTVCDISHFTTADSDRILDGEFSILGKVISTPSLDRPILDKNKILNRIDPYFLEGIFDSISPSTQQRSLQIADETYDGTPFDLNFSATIPGKSFSLMPLAIYI